MSVFIASLNSGSNGNCYYVADRHDAVLIDAGISCRETEKRMRRLGLAMDKVRAIFISHEHIDHIKGAEVLSKRYSLPVYITPATLGNCYMKTSIDDMRSFTAHVPVRFGNLEIIAFPKLHDAADPHSFVIDAHGVRIGVFTDIGEPCEHVRNYFAGCHAAFLEANYDDEMLENGRYPYHLKRRIKSEHGHMSNAQAVELFRTTRPSFMTNLFLAHLSKDNNSHEVALAAFQPHAANVAVTVASRFEETSLYEITVAETRLANAVQAALF